MRFTFITLLFLIPLLCGAQDRFSDSVRVILRGNIHDTTRVAAMNDAGVAIYSTQPDSAIAWWMRSDHLADSVRGKYSGNTLQRLLTLKGEALSNLGFLYMNLGLTSPALEYNFLALDIRDSIRDLHGQAESLNNIAYEYCELGDTVQALVYYERSAKKYEAIQDSGGVAYTYINRGRIYAAQKKDTDARTMYLAALKLLNGNDEQQHRGYSQCLNNLGTVELRAGRFESAREYILQSITVREAHNDLAGLAGSYISLGKLYDALGMKDSALYWTDVGYDIAITCHSATYRTQGAQLLSLLYAARGEDGKALEYYKIYIQVRDSVANEESGKKMVRKQLGYEYAQKAAADSIALINEQKLGELKLSRQRGYTIGGFSALAILAVLLVFVYRQRNRISMEKKRSDELLLNILPSETAEELKETGTAKTKKYDLVSVVFTDFKNFTQTAEKLSPEELVQLINFCYAEFDRIVTRNNVEKIKTIGDSYMCVGGLPVTNATHAVDAVHSAKEMLSFITKHNEERRNQGLPYFDIRIGIHTGTVVAGIVGIKKFAYDIWGDTVNIASRMESSGEPGRINISESTYQLVKDKFKCTHRGKIQAKNKGEIDMYFVE